MSFPKKDTSDNELATLEAEVKSLRNVLKNVKEASFTALRDQLISHQKEMKAHADAHDAEIQSLREKHCLDVVQQRRQEMKAETAKVAQAESIKSAVNRARQEWEKETQGKLAAAAAEWSSAEKERLIKLKVDLVHQNNAALAERDAYWKAELARFIPGDDAVQGRLALDERGQRRSGHKTSQNDPRKRTHPAILGTLILVLLGAAALYLFAPQWEPVAKATLGPVVAETDSRLKYVVYRVAPWLVPNDESPKSVEPPAIFIGSKAANLRAGPSLSSRVLRVMNQGAQVHPVGESNGWIRVRPPNSEGQIGWIHKSLLSDQTPSGRVKN